MKQIKFISLLFFILSCTSTKKNIATDNNRLNGTWLPIKQTMGNNELPAVLFAKQKLIISDSNYTVFAESVDKGIVKYDNSKMDIYGREGVNAGKHFTAIYKYENENLTVCYNLKGNGYPTLFETKDQPLFFLSVFKKEEIK